MRVCDVWGVLGWWYGVCVDAHIGLTFMLAHIDEYQLF